MSESESSATEKANPSKEGDIDSTSYPSKDAARTTVWDRLQEEKWAAFPFPPHGRIPNFKAAKKAAERLLSLPQLADIRVIKVNPDAPQRPLRELALRAGIKLLVPTPRLRDDFMLFDPEDIPPESIRQASAMKHFAKWSVPVKVNALPPVDLVVAGSVAVTVTGKRCGKGHGYSDLEYAILRELGHPPCPVATTVHDRQLVGDFPIDGFDLPLSIIATPTQVLLPEAPPPPPDGIRWDTLTPEDLEAMPVLARLKAFKQV